MKIDKALQIWKDVSPNLNVEALHITDEKYRSFLGLTLKTVK